MDYSQKADRPRLVSISGCGHSGTSILAIMLGAHPDVHSVPIETGAFLPKGSGLKDLSKWIDEACQRNSLVLCEKTPRHVRALSRIRREVPNVRFVIAVRDARDVALSIKNRLGSIERGINRWVIDNTAALGDYGEDCRFVRYEDLIENPPAILADVCKHIGLSYSPSMLEYHRDSREWFGADRREELVGQDGKDHIRLRNWQIHQPLMDRRGRWRTMLSTGEVSQVERACADLMKKFCYL